MHFDDVVVGHLAWIAMTAFRFCKNKPDADDLAQDTLYKLFANRDRYNASRDFKPWALTIMTNIIKTQFARRRRMPLVELCEGFEAISPIMADSLTNYNDILDAVRRGADRCVGVECVLLYSEGFSYDEIADIVGIKTGTVKSRIAAGRAAVLDALYS